MSDLSLGLIVALVSMVGTLLALGLLALLIAGLYRAFPESESKAPTPRSQVVTSRE
jgi:hypothetical protein